MNAALIPGSSAGTLFVPFSPHRWNWTGLEGVFCFFGGVLLKQMVLKNSGHFFFILREELLLFRCVELKAMRMRKLLESAV